MSLESDDDIREMKRSVEEIGRSMARIETQNLETRETIKRAFTTMERDKDHVDGIDRRVQQIEVVMPGLKEARGWVIALAAGAVCMILFAVGALVLKPPNYVLSAPGVAVDAPTHHRDEGSQK